MYIITNGEDRWQSAPLDIESLKSNFKALKKLGKEYQELSNWMWYSMGVLATVGFFAGETMVGQPLAWIAFGGTLVLYFGSVLKEEEANAVKDLSQKAKQHDVFDPRKTVDIDKKAYNKLKAMLLRKDNKSIVSLSDKAEFCPPPKQFLEAMEQGDFKRIK